MERKKVIPSNLKDLSNNGDVLSFDDAIACSVWLN